MSQWSRLDVGCVHQTCEVARLPDAQLLLLNETSTESPILFTNSSFPSTSHDYEHTFVTFFTRGPAARLTKGDNLMNYHRRALHSAIGPLYTGFYLKLCRPDACGYLHKMHTRRLLTVRLWRLNPLVTSDGGTSRERKQWLVRESVQLIVALSDSYLLPHIKLYHTIVPCR